jgi:hypothetical protein
VSNNQPSTALFTTTQQDHPMAPQDSQNFDQPITEDSSSLNLDQNSIMMNANNHKPREVRITSRLAGVLVQNEIPLAVT